MPRIDWPQRIVNCGRLNSTEFAVSRDERPHIEDVTQVDIDPSDFTGTDKTSVYVHRVAAKLNTYSLSETESGAVKIGDLPSNFQLRKDIAFITNYPVRPHLRDPGSVVNTSPYRPRSHTTYTQGEPRYEGSVQISTAAGDDVRVVEAFIDQLANPDNWFELPLPEPFLQATGVTAFDDGDLTISGGNNDFNLVGRFVRVGRRVARITAHRTSGAAHIIRIFPSLVNEVSATAFSNTHSLRARAVEVSPTGSTDYGADWTIDFEETDGVQ